MRTSRETDFRSRDSGENNFSGMDISQGLDLERPSLSPYFLLTWDKGHPYSALIHVVVRKDRQITERFIVSLEYPLKYLNGSAVRSFQTPDSSSPYSFLSLCTRQNPTLLYTSNLRKVTLSAVVPSSTSPLRLVNSQLVCLPPLGIFNNLSSICSICLCIYSAPN